MGLEGGEKEEEEEGLDKDKNEYEKDREDEGERENGDDDKKAVAVWVGGETGHSLMRFPGEGVVVHDVHQGGNDVS